MKFNDLKPKLLVFVVAAGLLTAFTGCEKKVISDDYYPEYYETVVVDIDNPPRETELTEELLKKEEVLDGEVYLRPNYIAGTIIIKDGVDVEKGKAIANDLAKAIKAKYSGIRVRVQATQNNQNIADITLD